MDDKHEGSPENCCLCQNSIRVTCPTCGHALTGKFDEHGRTVCANCNEPAWMGIGDYPD